MLDVRTLSKTPHGACTVSMLAVIGAFVAFSALARLLRGIYIYFLRPGKDLKKLGKAKDGKSTSLSLSLFAGEERGGAEARRSAGGETEGKARSILRSPLSRRARPS